MCCFVKHKPPVFPKRKLKSCKIHAPGSFAYINKQEKLQC
ncbi:hypothetical protein HMPREF9193_00134 [Treponema lecithinolyticum ATCC 700332]|uniref:Uncharacterized protein n=1 Tax=Treponema lecithinolyticum ATCC 700332 TaxID=1321815 RepID=A0ABN0P0S5_TRELE|nr:hypothetical protein HMPREF9193_00134 [Treponema lecithinolyticum ATCC 700332]